MKLANIRFEDSWAAGIVVGTNMLCLPAAYKAIPPDRPLPDTTDGIVAGGKEVLHALGRYTDRLLSADDESKRQFVIPQSRIEWGPCVASPRKIICIGLNYRKHAIETGAPIPESPVVFSKFDNALAGHLQPVIIPADTREMDYEAELAIVIGQMAESVERGSALDYVFGYAIANDLSARDWQMRTSQWLLGKTGNGFCPLGPYLVTADEVPDPNVLAIRLTVNGDERQNSNTSDMIFACDEIISYLSRHMTLQPGDVILTGTPEGVVLGLPPEERRYLAPGDVVTVEIEGLGSLTNRMVAPGSSR